jgi:Carboxypeptidase regulatory-like domain
MKFAVMVVGSLTLLGCSQSSPTGPDQPVPTASPAPTPSSSTWLWGMVIDETGACIVGATVEVVRGQSLGQSITQTTPCGAWDYDGGVVFRDLTPGVEMTLRASASGYAAQEKTVIPSLGPKMAVLFAPSRIQ